MNILRDVPTMGEPDHKTGEPGGHAEILYENVRVPFENMIGNAGSTGFALAQKRLGPGRIHHAMRWLGQSQRAFDMLCERALTRYTHGSLLAEKQMIQDWVAESYAEMQAARLLTLQAAWKMDQLHAAGTHYSDARVEIGVIKFWGAKVLYNVIDRAIQVHGSLGYTTDLPLESMYRAARAARIYDGPDEVHKVTVARQILKRYKAAEVPTEHVPTRRKAALEKFADRARRDRRLDLTQRESASALELHRGVSDAVVEELVPDDLEPECAVPVDQVALRVEHHWAHRRRQGLVHQLGGQPLATRARRRDDPTYAARAGGRAAEHPEVRHDRALRLAPQVQRVGLEVTSVDVGIDTLLLDDEHVRAELQDAVEHARRELGEPSHLDHGKTLRRYGKTDVTDVCAAAAPLMRSSACLPGMPLSMLTASLSE